MSPRILLDTNVLLSKTLRDWFLLLGADPTSGFEVFVSQPILDEFSCHVRRQKPLLHDGVRVQWIQQISNSCAGEPIAGFPIKNVSGYPDINDLHVHSAAVYGHISSVITSDEKLIQFSQIHRLGYTAISLDSFFTSFAKVEANKSCIQRAYQIQYDYLIRKHGVAHLSESLERAGAPQFAAFLRQEIGF